MHSELLQAIIGGLTVAMMFLLAVCAITLTLLQIGPEVRRGIAEFMRKLGRGGKVLAVAAFLTAVIYGGSKFRPSMGNAGADEGLNLIQIVASYDSTNDVTEIDVVFTGSGITALTPVSVRNNQQEQWRELEKTNPLLTNDSITNTLSFTVSGDAEAYCFWWVGTDTPAVIVETAGITITWFQATSQSVQISWTCDDPRATEFAVQRRRKGTAAWETVGVTSSLAYIYVGFTVGETWEWRVTATYAEGE